MSPALYKLKMIALDVIRHVAFLPERSHELGAEERFRGSRLVLQKKGIEAYA